MMRDSYSLHLWRLVLESQRTKNMQMLKTLTYCLHITHMLNTLMTYNTYTVWMLGWWLSHLYCSGNKDRVYIYSGKIHFKKNSFDSWLLKGPVVFFHTAVCLPMCQLVGIWAVSTSLLLGIQTLHCYYCCYCYYWDWVKLYCPCWSQMSILRGSSCLRLRNNWDFRYMPQHPA